MKNPFLKEPIPEEIDTNGLVVSNLIERTRSEMKTQRLINTMTTLAIGTTLGAIDGFSSNERAVSYYVVPAIFNGIMTLRSEVISRRHIKNLERIGPEIKEETDALRRALTEAGVPIPDLLQKGGVQERLKEGDSKPLA